MSSRRNVVHAKSHRPIPKASIRKRRNIDFPKFQFGRKNRPARLFTFPEKKNWVEKESSDRNPILQNEGFNQFPLFLLFKYLYRYFESGPTDSNFVWIRLLPSQSANKFRP